MEEEKISIAISEPTNIKLWHANLGIFYVMHSLLCSVSKYTFIF